MSSETFPRTASETARPASPSRLAIAVFVAMMALYFFSYFQRVGVPGTIFNELQIEVGMSAVSIAMLGSMFTWIYGGMQIVVGFAADRYGGARAFLAGGALLVAGSFWFPLADAPAAMFAARALTGLGASFMYLSLVKEIARIFGDARFTHWVGVLIGIGYAGGLTGTLPFERLSTTYGWRPTLIAVAGVMAVAYIAALLLLHRFGPAQNAGIPVRLSLLGEVLRDRRCRPLMVTSAIAFPIMFVIQTVLGKKFLEDFGGLASASAATVIMAMAAANVVCVTLGGVLPQRLGGRRRPWIMLGASCVVAATACLLLGTWLRAPGWVFILGYLLLSGSALASPSNITTIKELSRPEAVAIAISLSNGLSYLGSGVIGQIGGVILASFRGEASETPSGIVYPHVAYLALSGFLAVLSLVNFYFASRVPETGKAR